MRPRHPAPLAALRQPGREARLADALGRTDLSGRATRTAPDRCLRTAALPADPRPAAARSRSPSTPGHRHGGPGGDLPGVVDRLLARVGWAGVRDRYALPDRGYTRSG